MFTHWAPREVHASLAWMFNEMTEPEHKVLFRVVEEDGSVNVETLWASKVGDDIYRLDNTPFYAYSVSWQDEVYAPPDENEGFPTFQKVVKKSGNRTVRIVFEPPVQAGNESDAVLKKLKGLGCSPEAANPSYVTLNVPPKVSFEEVRAYLVGVSANFEHSDPTYEELFGEDA